MTAPSPAATAPSPAVAASAPAIAAPPSAPQPPPHSPEQLSPNDVDKYSKYKGRATAIAGITYDAGKNALGNLQVPGLQSVIELLDYTKRRHEVV